MSFLKNLFVKTPPVDYRSLVNNGALIIDVRTRDEFKSGNIRGSVNIPLDEISRMVNDLRKKNKAVITCCRSGARSGMAKKILESAGIECYNGGAWDELAGQLRIA